MLAGGPLPRPPLAPSAAYEGWGGMLSPHRHRPRGLRREAEVSGRGKKGKLTPRLFCLLHWRNKKIITIFQATPPLPPPLTFKITHIDISIVVNRATLGNIGTSPGVIGVVWKGENHEFKPPSGVVSQIRNLEQSPKNYLYPQYRFAGFK